MSLICFASIKRSPGTTLTALATAAAWPCPDGRRKLLLEADADGGSLAVRYQMATKPGLLTLAAAARKSLTREDLWTHAQALPGGLPVVLAPDGPEQATGVLRASGRELGDWLRGLPDVDVIVDLGRLSMGSAAMDLALGSDVLLIVARPEAEQLQPAVQRMTALARVCSSVGWVLIGEQPYSEKDVEDAYGFPVVKVIPNDSRAARLLETGTNPSKLKRSALVRSVSSLAEALSDWLHPIAPDDDSLERAATASKTAMPPPSGDAPASGGLSAVADKPSQTPPRFASEVSS